MPRIDPQKLLTCISVLLSPNGGIRSTNEVKRLASLMAKYSKKLVSKCIYIQILKCTDTELLGQFMGAGGWTLAHMWLTDGILTKNWPLVQELLELLLLCPVDVPRLQSNSAPKFVKGLSRDGGGNEGVRILATKLVEQWLKIAKGETMTITSQNSIIVNKENVQNAHNSNNPTKNNIFNEQHLDGSNESHTLGGHMSALNEQDEIDSDKDVSNENRNSCNEGLVFKITVKDGKQTVAKVNDTSPKKNNHNNNNNNNNNGSRNNDTTKDTDSGDSSEISTKDKSSKSRSVSGKKSRDDKESSKQTERRSKDGKDRERTKSKDRSRDKDKKSSSSSSSTHKSSSSGSKSLSSSSSSKNTSSTSSSSNKVSNSSSNKSHKSSGSSSSKNSSSSKDKDKHKSSSSSSSSSSKTSSSLNRDREKRDEKDGKNKSGVPKLSQADKDKATLAKILPPTINKIGKIPKKIASVDETTNSTESGASTDAPPAKKKSMSIEVRKDTDNRPKTVKTYNSQFRSHGLAEEAPPPPSRRDLKKPSTTPTPGIAIPISTAAKRSISPTNTLKELDKRIKIGATSPPTEKPGAIKLIPPKPKPSVLVESDMFMDAISAATSKKEVKKRKRRLSSSKEPDSPTQKHLKDSGKLVAAPLKFYQDTLDDSENKDEKIKEDVTKSNDDDSDESGLKLKKAKKLEKDASDDDTKTEEKPDDAISEPLEEESEVNAKREPGPGCGVDGPPGVLSIHRRKGPKKSLRWKPQEALEEIRYFELDENERVNVTKTFVDMKQMERVSERDAFHIGRKIGSEDLMVEHVPWVPLIIVDDVPEHPDGSGSKEREIQTEREKTCLKTIYFNRSMIPDSGSEPDVITYQNVEPQIIPLFDVTGNPDAVHDFTNMPWPEPKGSPPHKAENLDDMSNFNNFGQYSQFNTMNWPISAQTNMRPMAPYDQIMSQDTMNPMQPFHAPNIVPPGVPNFGPNAGGYINNFTSAIPPLLNDNRNGRINAPNWFRNNNNNNAGNWQQPPMGGNTNSQRPNWINNNNRRVCKSFQRGYCRHGDSCKFLHPGVNCPQF